MSVFGTFHFLPRRIAVSVLTTGGWLEADGENGERERIREADLDWNQSRGETAAKGMAVLPRQPHHSTLRRRAFDGLRTGFTFVDPRLRWHVARQAREFIGPRAHLRLAFLKRLVAQHDRHAKLCAG